MAPVQGLQNEYLTHSSACPTTSKNRSNQQSVHMQIQQHSTDEWTVENFISKQREWKRIYELYSSTILYYLTTKNIGLFLSVDLNNFDGLGSDFRK